jgi:arylsulfatase A-like enzyme
VNAARRALRTLLALGLAVCGIAVAFAAGAPDRARPNFVVLVADDWGFSDVGAFGGEIPTPHLDRLAERGVRFANFHVAGSCSPTRSMLLTGVDNHRNGVGNLVESMPLSHRGRPGYLGSLDTNVVTIATLLREAGYRTIASGKWNVGTEPHNLPDQRGFERSLVQGDTGSDNWDPQQRYLPLSDRVRWFEDGREATLPKSFYSSRFFVDKAIEYLRAGEPQGRPFFAYLGFQANHVPLQAPREFIDRHAGRYRAGWHALREARRDRAAALGLVPAGTPLAPQAATSDWSRLGEAERRYQERSMEVYAGMAEAMDHEVGRLVEYLRATGQYENTVFVFLSDNGPEGSDYREARLWLMTQYTRALDALGGPGAYAIMGPSWASAAASPLSGFKFFAGEGAIRVPLIVAGVPGGARGAIHHGLTHVTDVAPTLLDLAGVRHPGREHLGRTIEPMAGRSLLPPLLDPSRAVRGPDDVLGYELSGNAALFKGTLKLVRNLAPAGDGQWRLYDLSTDPGETRDLGAERPQVLAAMREDYERWARDHGVLPMPAGYSPTRQVLINSIVGYWWPTYRVPIVAALLLLAVLATTAIRRRRARTRAPTGASR